MPIGTASYLSGSRPRITEAAEARETSCSPERPPKRMPTRSRFFSGVREVVVFGIDSPLLVIGQRRAVVADEVREAFAGRNGTFPRLRRLQQWRCQEDLCLHTVCNPAVRFWRAFGGIWCMRFAR